MKADWEGDSVLGFKSNFSLPFISDAFAATGNPTLTYIKGNYNGLVAKTQTGSIIYVLAVPSIVTSSGGTLVDITTLSNKLLVSGQTNSGGITYATNTSQFLVYSSGALPSTTAGYQLFASGVANAYSGTSLASNASIQPYVSALASNNTSTLVSLGGGVVSSALGGGANSTPTSSTITYLTASGGTSTGSYSSGTTNYQYHIFTANGTFQITAGNGNIDYIVVGGGGGGGGSNGSA